MLAMEHEDFDPSKFSGALGRLQLAFVGPAAIAPEAKPDKVKTR